LRGAPLPHYMGETAPIEIARQLSQDVPCLIARVGETEGRATTHYLLHRIAVPNKVKEYDPELKSRLKLLAGYFPTTENSIDELARLYLSAINAIDIYASWTKHDRVLCPSTSKRVRLVDLDPFFTQHKWTLALKDRRVCIVSPFIDTMRSQYHRRTMLFPVPVLPDMHLVFVRAPMTHCETDTTGQSWFDNLSRLYDKVLETRADAVIIGAGAYGLPLGAKAKSHGINTIVLGGSTQLLFGIKGRRWENDRQYRALFNEHWVRPSSFEQPPGFADFEVKGGSYW
jgi:hypothetical protein